MYKLLHVHNLITFVWDSDKFVNDEFENEVLFIGSSTEDNRKKLSVLSYPYKIIDSSKKDIDSIIAYVNTFDGVVFYSLNNSAVQILVNLRPKIKTFLRFFGFELYNLCMDNYLSEKTLNLLSQQPSETKSVNVIKIFYNFLKRKLKIFLDKEYVVKDDNQERVYRKLDAIFVINEYEYNELRDLFYLPELIELQFTNHEKETHEFKTIKGKSNKIIVGNNGAEVNNHIDVLEIIWKFNCKVDVEFDLFFSYGNSKAYSYKIREMASEIKNVNLIEKFLSKEEFELMYESAAALVINSYRQNALGNIFTALKVGCKVYLNRRNSTYKWLISKGFLISEVDDLESDIELGNIKLSVEEQQRNIDLFLLVMKEYSVRDFLSNVIDVLKDK
ncbi:MAG: hypothetical protein V4565_10975 [Bacteroidota bacterium]